MTPRRVLVTNNALGERAGTETYVLDLVRGLRARGDDVACYAGRLGAVADQLAAEGVPVVDDLSRAPFTPDVIHGHHHVETMTALARFGATPALYVCHGAVPWEEMPPRHPRILRHVAVCEPTRERCVAEAGVPPERVRVVPNFVDLDRFLPRGPLPERPRRALVWSNYASASTHLPAVEAACRRAHVELDARGIGVGDPCSAPQDLLPDYDVVFAKGRAALEAAVVGCAVVLCDAGGLGPLLAPDDLPRVRALNLGFRTLTDPLEPAGIAARLEAYDPAVAAEVTRRLRATAGAAPAVDALRALHGEVVEEFAAAGGRPDPAAERVAVADYVRRLGELTKSFWEQGHRPRRLRRRGWARVFRGKPT